MAGVCSASELTSYAPHTDVEFWFSDVYFKRFWNDVESKIRFQVRFPFFDSLPFPWKQSVRALRFKFLVI